MLIWSRDCLCSWQWSQDSRYARGGRLARAPRAHRRHSPTPQQIEQAKEARRRELRPEEHADHAPGIKLNQRTNRPSSRAGGAGKLAALKDRMPKAGGDEGMRRIGEYGGTWVRLAEPARRRCRGHAGPHRRRNTRAVVAAGVSAGAASCEEART